jgi:hypothetical protein
MPAPNDANTPSTRTKPGDHEEPEITQEESIPSDGKDEVGEKMMEELGREKSKDEKR